MKGERKRLFIWEIVNKVNEFVHEKDLFCGGCCFAASVLAEILTRLGIKYRTVLFQGHELARVKDFDVAVNNDDCDHVAIEVTVGGEKVIIGDYSAIDNYYDTFDVRHSVRRYRGITPQMLRAAYYGNSWNPRYETSNNAPFREEMYKIADKYFQPKAA